MLEQREFTPFPARQEHQAARLVLDQALQQSALLGGELAVFQAHVSQENHVVLGKLVEPRGELLDVVFVAAADLGEPGMKQQARKVDARVAREGVAEVAVFPPWIRFHHEDPQLFLADRDRSRQLVVVDERLFAMFGNGERDGEVAGGFGFPRDPIADPAHRRNANFLGFDVAVGRSQGDRRGVFARQRAVDGEWNANRLARHAERGGVQAQKLDIRQPGGASDRNREHRHSLHAQPRRGLHRRRPFVPVAVRNEHNAPQVGDFLGALRERVVNVGAVPRLLRRERLNCHVHPRAQRAPARRVGHLRDRLTPSLGRRAGVDGGQNVARVHTGRGVPEHGDGRLFLGPIFLDPLGLVQNQRPRRKRARIARARAARTSDGSRCVSSPRSTERPPPARATPTERRITASTRTPASGKRSCRTSRRWSGLFR